MFTRHQPPASTHKQRAIALRTIEENTGLAVHISKSLDGSFRIYPLNRDRQSATMDCSNFDLGRAVMQFYKAAKYKGHTSATLDNCKVQFDVVQHSAHGEGFAVHWETNGHRFHVWLAGPGIFDPEAVTLYKNPAKDCEERFRFDTRQLDLSAKRHRSLVAALWSIPPAAYKRATLKALQEREAKAATQAREAKEARRARYEELKAEFEPG